VQKAYISLKEKETREKLWNWWETIAKGRTNRSARARLRRAERPDDVVLTEPFFSFLRQMPGAWAQPENLPTSAIVAAALAHVEKHREGKFAKQLASPKKIGDRAVMSELRFQQLQKSRDPEEFFRRLLRAIHMLDKSVNIYSLAESILLWMNEYRFGVDREPNKRLAFIWAQDYYTVGSTTQNQS